MLPPDQLRDERIRFCKVTRDGKNAFEKAFNTPEKAYKYTSCELFGQWIMSKNGNYGVLCGYGGLFILDFDDEDTYKKVKRKLPPTMVVKSGGKGLPHLYYYANDTTDIKTVLFDGEDGNRIIDLQGQGKYCVGPGSKVNDGKNEYKLISKMPIAHVSYKNIVAQLKEMFPHVHVAKSKNMPRAVKYKPRVRDDKVEMIKRHVSMPRLLHHYGSNTQKRRCECPHGHGSTSGANVAFDNELYYCFHCLKGGDIFSLALEKEGMGFVDTIEWFKDTFGIKL